MKLLIASDIHGSARWCQKLIQSWREEGSPRMLLLGDLLYHGPRNDLPEEYAPKQVIEMLNSIRENLLCVRGNCEAEVDQMVLSFPVMADYCALELGGRILYATHGHIYGQDNPPPLIAGDVLLCGHTHIPAFVRYANFTYINPGSTSIPKGGSVHSYLLFQDGHLMWKDLANGSVWKEETLS